MLVFMHYHQNIINVQSIGSHTILWNLNAVYYSQGQLLCCHNLMRPRTTSPIWLENSIQYYRLYAFRIVTICWKCLKNLHRVLSLFNTSWFSIHLSIHSILKFCYTAQNVQCRNDDICIIRKSNGLIQTRDVRKIIDENNTQWFKDITLWYA